MVCAIVRRTLLTCTPNADAQKLVKEGIFRKARSFAEISARLNVAVTGKATSIPTKERTHTNIEAFVNVTEHDIDSGRSSSGVRSTAQTK